MISDNELSDLISVPKEWRNGDEKIQWPKYHDKFNLEWLETLWKYLGEYCKNDLSMMENFNIIFALQSPTNSLKLKTATKKDTSPVSNIIDNSKNITLFKLSKNSNLVYTPSYVYEPDSVKNGTTNNTDSSKTESSINEETYAHLIRILSKLGFECIESISNTILSHPLFQNYVPKPLISSV